ncbi:hypothetical protein ABZW18_34120 [Streptomyces sp. NPDC004647]|uniref:hypothetical protein n=1 Tax=Streptomyces sp. NPDC004647 TaxID=3154671 RepID=UPI0033BD3D55
MDDPPRQPDTGDDTGAEPDRGSTPGTPRWVKVFGTIALVVIVLFVILLLTKGPGEHGPARHFGGQAPTTSVTADLTPPGGGLGDHHAPRG